MVHDDEHSLSEEPAGDAEHAGQTDAAIEAEFSQAESTESDSQTELAEAQDRVLRLQAELENLRRRTRREIGDANRFASLPLMRELLPVIDNIDRAIEAAEKTDDATGLLQGVRMMGEQLTDTLAKHGCTEIIALDQAFDPNLHEAILQQPSADHAPGTVIAVTQVGYVLHDRVVRPSQVIVSSDPEK